MQIVPLPGHLRSSNPKVSVHSRLCLKFSTANIAFLVWREHGICVSILKLKRHTITSKNYLKRGSWEGLCYFSMDQILF